MTLTVPIEKEVTKIAKNGEEITKNISHILQLIGSARFTANSLLNLINNIPEGNHKIKCKHKCLYVNINIATCFLNTQNSKDDLIKYKCLCCQKNYQQKFDEKLKE